MPKWKVVSLTPPELVRRDTHSWWLIAKQIKSVAGILMNNIPVCDYNKLGRSLDGTGIAVRGDATIDDFEWIKG